MSSPVSLPQNPAQGAGQRLGDPGPGKCSVLTAQQLTIRFGGLVAVNQVNFDVPAGGIVSLIGPNGAGKTTFFNALTGLYPLATGRVVLAGRDVTGMAPHRIAKFGLARTFQNIRLFGLMTAVENLTVAMHSHLRSGIVGTILRTPRQRREERQAQHRARQLLAFVGLEGREQEYARNLSYGDQRRLEVARALALQPRVLLLDEPTAGMNPRESQEFTQFVRRLRDECGLSVLLIEHDMNVVMRVSDRITVLDRGQVIAQGSAAEIRQNPQVVAAYLGKSELVGEVAR
jgi:branched-chain amino acid transport system ATP-binding protein